MNWHDDGPESGPSADDIAEALRLQNLHRKSQAQEACLWCRFTWPCQHRRWSDEIMSAAGDGLEQPTAKPAGRRPISTVPLPRGGFPDRRTIDPERDT